jgi:hypothetical protein
MQLTQSPLFTESQAEIDPNVPQQGPNETVIAESGVEGLTAQDNGCDNANGIDIDGSSSDGDEAYTNPNPLARFQAEQDRDNRMMYEKEKREREINDRELLQQQGNDASHQLRQDLPPETQGNNTSPDKRAADFAAMPPPPIPARAARLSLREKGDRYAEQWLDAVKGVMGDRVYQGVLNTMHHWKDGKYVIRFLAR